MVEVIEELPSKGSNRGKQVRCLCDCGNEFVARKADITSGHTVSCGCKRGKRKPATVEPSPKVASQPKPKLASHRVTKPKPIIVLEEDDEEEYDECEELIQQVARRWDKTREEIAESLGFSVRHLESLSRSELYDALERVGAI